MLKYREQKEIDNDIEFYKKLGFSTDKAKYLATHVFSTEYTSNKKRISEYNEAHFKGRIGGLSFGCSGVLRSVSFNNAFCKSGTLNASAMSSEVSLDSVDDIDFSDDDSDESYESVEDFAQPEVLPLKQASYEVRAIQPQIIDKLSIGNHDSYADIKESSFKDTIMSPLSTFATTANKASFNIIRGLLSRGMDVSKSAVRTEELLNYFDYDMPDTRKENEAFSISTEITDIKDKNTQYLWIGIKGRKEENPDQNIVFLLDVSGSMSCNDIIMQKALFTILHKLKPTDIISVVTYSSRDHVILSGEKAKDKDKIIDKIKNIDIEGCTNGSAGINMAYELAEKYYLNKGSNRVILMTDGDFNFGSCRNEELEALIIKKRDTGCFLTLLGLGVGNYDDKKMETLTKNGNGNYFKIIDDGDISDILDKNINSTLVAIAEDVKAQIEFNPSKVKGYRLVGYENRELSSEQFRDDKVKAEPVGSNHSVVAVYEIETTDTKNIDKNKLKYQKLSLTDSNEYCTITLRYKDIKLNKTVEIQKAVDDSSIVVKSNNSKIMQAVIILANKLRKSPQYTKGDIRTALSLIDRLGGKKVEILRDMLKKA